ncbi:hypothetical protein AVEN_1029-1 [Araneus ventricosus]|uniref:Uncharacterized protein n=1 Tax=Araneus ventricosus TaxID=182803 RepID=A0A4Y2L184_ARAVE|nr:hypothetical protein AVEN_1029-1 [Araneus ventricosus]
MTSPPQCFHSKVETLPETEDTLNGIPAAGIKSSASAAGRCAIAADKARSIQVQVELPLFRVRLHTHSVVFFLAKIIQRQNHVESCQTSYWVKSGGFGFTCYLVHPSRVSVHLTDLVCVTLSKLIIVTMCRSVNRVKVLVV